MDELSQNYASALYGLYPRERHPEVLSAFDSVIQDLETEENFAKLLSSYNLSFEEKEAIIQKVYGEKYASLTHFVPFLLVVIAHHKTKKLPLIYQAYRSLVFDEEGIKEGIAYSATPLTAEQIRKNEEEFGKRLGCRVHLKNIVDHRLLGGVKVAIDDRVFDGTLRAKLEDMRQALQGGKRS